MEDLEALMQERPDGVEPSVSYDEIADGFTVTNPEHPEWAGMVAHRGVLTGEEHIDLADIQRELEDELGYTLAEVQAVYKVGGKLTPTQREFRTYIDARILALSSSGGSMKLLAESLDISEKTIDRALVRARELHIEPQVKNPAVTRPCMCFICQDMTAKPRRRRFSTSPPSLRGTVNLCAVDYSAGFDTEPGNPAYWEFRRRRR